MFYTFDNPRKFDGQKTWWMSFPRIESRKIKPEPFGPAAKFKVGDHVRFKENKTKRNRKILKVEWHMHRYQWVYIIETSSTDRNHYFEPYWFEAKLELIRKEI